MTRPPNIGLQRTSRRWRAAAEAGSLGVPRRPSAGIVAMAILALTVGMPRSARAAVRVDGTDFLQSCQIDLDYYQNAMAGKEQTVGFIGHCVSYLRGFRDAAHLAGWAPFCVPDQTTNMELLDGVVKALKSHGDLEKLSTAQAAVTGLREAFPCGAKGRVKK